MMLIVWRFRGLAQFYMHSPYLPLDPPHAFIYPVFHVLPMPRPAGAAHRTPASTSPPTEPPATSTTAATRASARGKATLA